MEMTPQILVVDDESAIRGMMSQTLEKQGYRVETLDSGERAIAAIRSRPFELVFLDLKMPELSGIETLREIRKFDTHVPIYIITGFYDTYAENLRTAAESEGLNFEVLQKPIDTEALLAVVKSVIGTAAK